MGGQMAPQLVNAAAMIDRSTSAATDGNCSRDKRADAATAGDCGSNGNAGAATAGNHGNDGVTVAASNGAMDAALACGKADRVPG
jgi:hypothetical protein